MQDKFVNWKAFMGIGVSVVKNGNNHAMFAFGQVNGGCYKERVKIVPVIYWLHVDISDTEGIMHASYFPTDLHDTCFFIYYSSSSFHFLSSTFRDLKHCSFFYFLFSYFFFLATLGSIQDLRSPTRDWTSAPGSGSIES